MRRKSFLRSTGTLQWFTFGRHVAPKTGSREVTLLGVFLASQTRVAGSFSVSLIYYNFGERRFAVIHVYSAQLGAGSLRGAQKPRGERAGSCGEGTTKNGFVAVPNRKLLNELSFSAQTRIVAHLKKHEKKKGAGTG